MVVLLCIFLCIIFLWLDAAIDDLYYRRNVPLRYSVVRDSSGVNSFYKPRQGHLFTGTPGKMVIASGTTCEFKERYIILVFMRNNFDNQRCFLFPVTEIKKFTLCLPLNYGRICRLCAALQYATMWICMPVLNPLISLRFCFVALLFLWRCVAFVFCMPSSSDLLWPPSAREHSADPSGKVCTLDFQ